MADAQLVVYNDAGIEQVSMGGFNLSLVYKQVIGASAFSTINGPRSTGKVFSVTVTATNPVIALSTSATGLAGAVTPMVTNNGNGTWTVKLYGGCNQPSPSVAGSSALTATVTLYVFDNAPAPTSGPGFALYNAAGKCIFNAAYPCARVRQMLDDNSNVHGYGTSLAVPGGKTYAWVLRSCFGFMYVESYNNTTGDRLVYDWRSGFSGGASATTIQAGSGYLCMMDGAISTKAGISSVGGIWLQHGCKTGASTYFSDAMILDVTGL